MDSQHVKTERLFLKAIYLVDFPGDTFHLASY